MEGQGLRELYVEELKDILDAEHRLVKALPKLAKAASNEELKSGFESHLEQTKGHVERLNRIFEGLGQKASAKKCPGMAGIVTEGSEILKEDYDGALKDAALISAAQRAEHYEIAAYGCVATWADVLGESEASSLLKQTLEEEKQTDEKLTQLSETINQQANQESETEAEGEESTNGSGSSGRSRSAKASD